MLKYSHPWLAVLVRYWPAAIVLSGILLVIAILALITRWWDERDVAARVSASHARSAVSTAGDWTGRTRSSMSLDEDPRLSRVSQWRSPLKIR
jgi:hypothetical protein